jgi:hypothetical protein
MAGTAGLAIKATFRSNVTANAALLVQQGAFSSAATGAFIPPLHLLTLPWDAPPGTETTTTCMPPVQPLCSYVPTDGDVGSSSSSSNNKQQAGIITIAPPSMGTIVKVVAVAITVDIELTITTPDLSTSTSTNTNTGTASVPTQPHPIVSSPLQHLALEHAGEAYRLAAPISLVTALDAPAVIKYALQQTLLVVHDAIEVEEVLAPYGESTYCSGLIK